MHQRTYRSAPLRQSLPYRSLSELIRVNQNLSEMIRYLPISSDKFRYPLTNIPIVPYHLLPPPQRSFIPCSPLLLTFFPIGAAPRLRTFACQPTYVRTLFYRGSGQAVLWGRSVSPILINRCSHAVRGYGGIREKSREFSRIPPYIRSLPSYPLLRYLRSLVRFVLSARLINTFLSLFLTDTIRRCSLSK